MGNRRDIAVRELLRFHPEWGGTIWFNRVTRWGTFSVSVRALGVTVYWMDEEESGLEIASTVLWELDEDYRRRWGQAIERERRLGRGHEERIIAAMEELHGR